MNSPSLRFQEFKLPWEVKPIGDYLVERTEYPTSDLPIYSLTIEQGVTPKTERYERSFLTKEDYQYKVMLQNDFAYNPMNLRFGAIARHKHDFSVLVSKYYDIFHCTPELNPYFAETYFKTYNNICLYNKMATGSLEEKKRVHFSDFKKFKIPFPVLNEQQKIAAFLTAVDTKIEQLTQKEALLKQYKKGVMQKIFSQEIRFKADDGSEFPEWSKVRLSEVLLERKLLAKKSEGLEHISLTTEGVLPKSDRYERDFLVRDDSEKKYKVTKLNDICYNPANIKFGVICRNTYGDGIFSPIYVTFEVQEADATFVEYFVTRWDFINKARKYEEGTVYERQSVKAEDLLKMEMFLPTRDEQEKIAKALSALDHKLETITKQINQARRFKIGLLQQMFV